MPAYRLDLAYDGTGFHGYARQADVRTVQGDLEAALAPIAGEVATVAAGRTDAGVHAQGQVVSFETSRDLDPEWLQRSLNKRLGPEIAVTSVTRVPAGFNARFAAASRSYRYLVLDQEVPDPFLRHTAWHVPIRLDEHAMNACAAEMVGEHDFASFCRAAPGRSTVRTVLAAAWVRFDASLLRFDITARSFCHQMVRSLVAMCVDVGRHHLPPEAVPAIFAACDRNAARGAAPAHGLTLMEVAYP